MKNINQLVDEISILFKNQCKVATLIILFLGQSALIYSSSIPNKDFIESGINLYFYEHQLFHLLKKSSDSLNKDSSLLNSHLNVDKDWLFYKCTNLENKRMDCGRELTNRELEILSLVSKELSSDEIADVLILSKHTIISHRKKLLIKMGVKNTAGMIRKGFELGYLSMTKRS